MAKKKFTLEFDEAPALLFISHDGEGSMDELYVNGEWVYDAKAVEIKSEVSSITEYTTTRYPLSKKEKWDLFQNKG